MQEHLPECLDSLLCQGIPSSQYEVIVINDGSLDGTLEIAQKYARDHSNIQVIDKVNAGVGAARNSGLDKAIGTYVYFLDPDDYLAKSCMPIALAAAENNQLDILTFHSTSIGKNVKLHESVSDLDKFDNPALRIKDGIEYISDAKFRNEIWWYLIRRDYMSENGFRFIEGRWMEDAILTAELFCNAGRIAFLDLDMHRYRILPTSAMRNKAPDHYKKVIFDNANAALVFVDLIESLDSNHPYYEGCRKRLKTRQQSFVFFLLVRLMKSDIEIAKIKPMLNEFEDIDAYPLNQFLGQDYHGLDYSLMVYIFNHKPLIEPFAKVFRFFYRLAY